MACRLLFQSSLSSIPLTAPTPTTTSIFPRFPSSSLQTSRRKRDACTPLCAVGVNGSPTVPMTVEHLEGEFSGHGVTFEAIGNGCVVKLGLENGTRASVMLPSGLITSYKVPLWHGDKLELLHTLVLEGDDGGALVQGGMSLDIRCEEDGDGGGGYSWSPSVWALQNVKGSPEDSVQIEMISTDLEEFVQVRHILTLQEDALSSELEIINPKSSSLRILGGLMSHLTVSTPDATYAIGLEGSDFFSRPPASTDFTIIPPDIGQKRGSGSGWFWGQIQRSFLSGQCSRNQKEDDAAEGEEDENYKHLAEQMSRIYTSAPTNFTIIDRGRRNSIVIRRDGFEEMYIMSPGSGHEFYGKYAYICIGQTAMLKPIIIGPKDVWKAGQHLHNPNL